MSISSRLRQGAFLFSAAVLLTACSPAYDWREARGAKLPFYANMPGKVSEYTRPVKLGPYESEMTMSATQVDGATFAVGAAQMADAAQSQQALAYMKEALLRNIDGKIVREQGLQAPYSQLQLEAKGLQQMGSSRSQVMLLGRFYAVDKRIYQVIVVGNDKPQVREAAETFFASFKPN
ncbi:hypothetical protein V8J88_07945 [Massilia sp. W12]|uniref:hypothetical protein n=1 Tax=Massilia sp. W12 TaxID=3126507 RepID=UPI0030D5DCDC